MNRRVFVKNGLYASAIGIINTLPIDSKIYGEELTHLTILHTNDVHSRIDPFPNDGSRNAGQGGAVKRAHIINNIRGEVPHVLLLDAGDIFQGTPYFNIYGGEIEIKLMSSMKYDASTMGNHDFDAGIDGFAKQLQWADFPFVLSNYDVSDTILHDQVIPYKIWEIEDIKVGLYALGIELDGLVPRTLYKNTVYQNPIEKARYYESLLKNELDCDYIICLSHLGFKYREDKVSDVVIARQTADTDLIIGGHTHSFLMQPEVEKNLRCQPVLINQAGWAGIMLGRIDITFEKMSKRKYLKDQNIYIQ